jgi:hypothetical protein
MCEIRAYIAGIIKNKRYILSTVESRKVRSNGVVSEIVHELSCSIKIKFLKMMTPSQTKPIG